MSVSTKNTAKKQTALTAFWALKRGVRLTSPSAPGMSGATPAGLSASVPALACAHMAAAAKPCASSGVAARVTSVARRLKAPRSAMKAMLAATDSTTTRREALSSMRATPGSQEATSRAAPRPESAPPPMAAQQGVPLVTTAADPTAMAAAPANPAARHLRARDSDAKVLPRGSRRVSMPSATHPVQAAAMEASQLRSLKNPGRPVMSAPSSPIPSGKSVSNQTKKRPTAHAQRSSAAPGACRLSFAIAAPVRAFSLGPPV